jgi:histidine transport system permease protein
MIEIIQQYWKAYLWYDGYYVSGVAMSLWLLVVSIMVGFVLSVPLAVARVEKPIRPRTSMVVYLRFAARRSTSSY